MFSVLSLFLSFSFLCLRPNRNISATKSELIWSIITIVPTGYREFCYIVDGQYMVSRKHPTNPEGTRNWRKVYGPPSRKKIPEPRTKLVRAMDSLADYIRLVLMTTFHNDAATKRQNSYHHVPDADLEDGDSFFSMTQQQRESAQMKRRYRRCTLFHFVVVAAVVYCIGLIIVQLRHVLR